jgi:hypothetical protein
MAKKITELGAATTAAQTDLLAMVDMSGTPVTKKITLALIRALNILSGGTSIGVRPKLNFIAGSDTTVAVSDNPGQDRVDVTISTTLGPNSQAHKLYLFANFN